MSLLLTNTPVLTLFWRRSTIATAMATYTYETIPEDPNEEPRRFEIQQKMTDDPLTHDPESGLPVKRVITGGCGIVTHGTSILSMKSKGTK